MRAVQLSTNHTLLGQTLARTHCYNRMAKHALKAFALASQMTKDRRLRKEALANKHREHVVLGRVFDRWRDEALVRRADMHHARKCMIRTFFRCVRIMYGTDLLDHPLL